MLGPSFGDDPLHVKRQQAHGRSSEISRHQFDYTGGVSRRFEQDGQRHLWQKSRAVFDIVANDELLRLLAMLHGGVPVAPVQSNNFYIGSMTPPHSDVIFMDTLPKRGQMVAVWTALEDVHPDAGPVLFYDGSHKVDRLWDHAAIGAMRYADNSDGTFSKRRYVRAAHEARGNMTYPEYARQLGHIIRERGWRPTLADRMRRGDIAVWAASLLHGGSEVRDWNRTRLSMTAHYLATDQHTLWRPSAWARARW